MSDLRQKLLKAKIASFHRTGKASALSGALEDAELTAEAGVLSDLWNAMFLLSIPREERQLRVHMVGYAKEAMKDLRNIELQVLNKDLEGVIFAYQTFANNFLDSFVSDFHILKEMENTRLGQKLLAPPKKEEQQPKETPPEDTIPPSGEGEEIHNEAPPPVSEPFNLESKKKELTKNLVSLEVQKKRVEKIKAQDDPSLAEVVSRYNRLDQRIKALNTEDEANKIAKEQALLLSLMNNIISEAEQKTSYLIDDDMRKVAQKAVQRWIKRKLMNISPTMRDRIYYKIVQDIIDLDPLLKGINSKLKDRKVLMRDFEGDVRAIVSKIHQANNRILALTQNIRSSQKKPTIKREVITNLRGLNKKLKEAFKKPEDEALEQ